MHIHNHDQIHDQIYLNPTQLVCIPSGYALRWWRKRYSLGSLTNMLADDDAVMDRPGGHSKKWVVYDIVLPPWNPIYGTPHIPSGKLTWLWKMDHRNS